MKTISKKDNTVFHKEGTAINTITPSEVKLRSEALRCASLFVFSRIIDHLCATGARTTSLDVPHGSGNIVNHKKKKKRP